LVFTSARESTSHHSRADVNTSIATTPIPFFRATKANKNGESLDDFRRTLEEVAAKQKVHVIRGTDLVPADHNYFNDWSHPNDAGHLMIAQNLLAALKTLHLTSPKL